MEKWVSKWLEMHSQRQRFFTYSYYVAACALGSSLWLSVPSPLCKQPLWVQPFLYIYFVVFILWRCVVNDSNFDLHLQLRYSKR